MTSYPNAALGALAQSPEAAGGAAATTMATDASGKFSPARSIALGVTTGIIIWFITRWLDGKFTRR